MYTINISQGGMRLSVGARAPLGTAIDIILTLPDGTRLHLPGKVAHLGPGDGGDLGVRFDDAARAHAEGDRALHRGARRPGARPASKTKSIPPGDAHKEEDVAAMRPGVLFGALFLLLAAARRPIPRLSPVVEGAAAAPRRTDRRRRRRLVAEARRSPRCSPRALPADGTADVVLVDWPATPGTPHVRAATVVGRRAGRDPERAARRRQLPQDRSRR